MPKFYTYLWLREDGTSYYVGKASRVGRAHDNSGHTVKKPYDNTRIILQSFLTEEDAFEAEKFLIKFYGRKDLNSGCLRNLTDGGEGNSGAIFSAEHRKKLSEAKRGYVPWIAGRKHSSETIKRLQESHVGQIAWNKGKKCSAETCAKIGAASKGRVLSAEHRQRISEGLKKSGRVWTMTDDTREKISQTLKGRLCQKEL